MTFSFIRFLRKHRRLKHVTLGWDKKENIRMINTKQVTKKAMWFLLKGTPIKCLSAHVKVSFEEHLNISIKVNCTWWSRRKRKVSNENQLIAVFGQSNNGNFIQHFESTSHKRKSKSQLRPFINRNNNKNKCNFCVFDYYWKLENSIRSERKTKENAYDSNILFCCWPRMGIRLPHCIGKVKETDAKITKETWHTLIDVPRKGTGFEAKWKRKVSKVEWKNP